MHLHGFGRKFGGSAANNSHILRPVDCLCTPLPLILSVTFFV
jgi:hypothetical protein